MSFNLPNPCLLGIILVSSTHSGPLIAFNYPPDLSDDDTNTQYESSDDDNNETQVEQDVDADDEYGRPSQYQYTLGNSDHLKHFMGTKKELLQCLDEQELSRKKSTTHRANLRSKKSTTTPTNGTIFGIERGYLCEMLAPPRNMCNSRFEITIDDKIFMGLPIHKLDNGSWRENTTKPPKNVDTTDSPLSSPKSKVNLDMFHLVFVLNPPMIECNYRIDEMFHYVISRLSLVLRYEQLKHEYVSNQIRLIYSLKEELSATSPSNEDNVLYSILIEKSSLCKLISDCYNAISQSKIANLSINNRLRSFQIPIKTEFKSLPEPSVPFIPGSCLSSTTNLLLNSGLINIGETTRYGQTTITQEQDENSNSFDDVVYFALLLLDDPQSIIRDIKADQDEAMASFIRLINPTQPISSLAGKNPKNIAEIKSFVYHLVYWRKARIIQPISTRSVYIISPMAPITISLFHDIKRFREQFPTLPSLPHFLKQLSPHSRKPQQFATMIPSRDHRSTYLEALAWLICNGYVTQLQTFIWLKISQKVKMKVEEDYENETAQTKKRTSAKKTAVGGTDNSSKVKDDRDTANTALTQNEQDIEDLQNRLTSIGPKVTLGDEEETIILDPGRATALERRWINKIVLEECKLSQELLVIFYKLLKYMNGINSLEYLLLKENVSRNELRKLLLEIEDHIITVRHW
jgi:hypothetical protein